MVSIETTEKLEDAFQKMEASDSKSLLKKYLTKEIFNINKHHMTRFGSTLLDVIQSGLENLDSGIGVYAPDFEAYSTFSDIFDPIIADYHKGFKQDGRHPLKDWGDLNSFGNLDPTGKYIISTRVRCGRSIIGFPFCPRMTEAEYLEIEQIITRALSKLTGELQGTYYPLTDMTQEVKQTLIDEHFLFKQDDRFLQAANACRFWPTGRGIFYNEKKTFLVWCNEEDHLRVISMQKGGDLGEVYRRLVNGVDQLEKRIPFNHNHRLGFLTICPSNLGTTIRASVHIKLPRLARNSDTFNEVKAKYNLQVRGTHGEHTETKGDVFDVSNYRRMGMTEYQAVKEMYDGVTELINTEREL